MSGPMCLPRITVQGSVVTSIAPRRDLRPQVERILSDHFARFVGVPVAVYTPHPGDVAAVVVCGHTVPVVAGWPDDPEAQRHTYQQNHAVAVVYPPFDSAERGAL